LEERREGEIEDYWLIQFQRLMDQKPETLIIKVEIVKTLEFDFLQSSLRILTNISGTWL
jgi:hypothetical protein